MSQMSPKKRLALATTTRRQPLLLRPVRACLTPCLAFSLALISACQGPASEQQSAPLSAALPDEIVGYGGSDNIQSWLFRLQSYAQGARPNTPPFAMLFPTFLSTGLGITLPQVIDLSKPARWLVAPPPRARALAQAQSGDSEPPSPERVPSPKSSRAWRGVVALKLRAGLDRAALKQALLSSYWDDQAERRGEELLHAQMREELAVGDEGHLLLVGEWLFVGNDLKLMRETIPALLRELKRPLSRDFMLTLRLHQLGAYLSEAYPERFNEMNNELDGGLKELWYQADAELASLELKASNEALQVVVSSQNSEVSQLSKLTIDGEEPLRSLPRNTGGFLITSAHFPAFEALFKEHKEELPATLKLLKKPPKLGLSFAMNEQLELSGLITGGGAERSAWVKAFVHALQQGLNAEHRAQERAERVSSGPMQPQRAVLVKDEPLRGHEVDALKHFGLPQLELEAPSVALSTFRAQLSEARLRYAPEATYVTFGPQSRAYLELWAELARSQQLGILERSDLKRFKGQLSQLLLMLYLAPPSVDRMLGEAPQGRPQDSDSREGISLIARASPKQMSLAFTLPVGVAARLVKWLKSGSLDISRGLNPKPRP